MTAAALGLSLLVSQSAVTFAMDSNPAGSGDDIVAEESMAPQQGAGIGLSVPAGSGKTQEEGIAGSIAMGSGADLGFFGTEYSSDADSDIDTTVLDDIQLTLKIQGPYILMNAEDKYFYYIYPWGDKGIPDIIVGAFDWDTTDGFFDSYYDYMLKSRPDLTVAEDVSEANIGGKSLQKVVYNYTVQGYAVRDTRYIWLGPNQVLYMFAKREIPDIGYTLGNTLEDIIAAAGVTGAQDQSPSPVPETTAGQDQSPSPVAETTAGQDQTPAPETTAGQDQSPAPSGNGSLYVQNEDSSWTVTTDYYTMIIPPAWTGHFNASVSRPYGSGYDLEVVNKESADANLGGHLFTVMLMPQSEDYTILPSYDYLGTMTTGDGTFNVVIQYPTDVQTGDIWSEFYKILNGDKNSAITTIRPVQGVTWTLPDGNVISGDSSTAAQTASTQSAPSAGQTETTVTQPQTGTTQPEVTQPPAANPGSGDVLGSTEGNSYVNKAMGLRFDLPAGWIFANNQQLESMNKGLSSDQYLSSIDSGIPVCVAYAQSANGMELMNVVVVNNASFMNPGVTQITQEDVKAILNEATGISSAALESANSTVTGASVNTVNCMGQTCYSLDISFNYSGFSGIQKQIGIPAGTYIALVTVRSVSGDNTQATFDMFSGT